MTIDAHKVFEEQVTKMIVTMFANEVAGMPRDEALAKFENGVVLLADVVEAARKRLAEIQNRGSAIDRSSRPIKR